MALSIIEGARAGEELGDLPYHVHPLPEVEELATLILEQEDKIRENLGDLWLKLRKRKGEIQIHTPVPLGLQ